MTTAVILFVICIAVSFNSHFASASVACDYSKCSVIIYKDCPNSVACGSSNGKSCAYLPMGRSSAPGCAWNPCATVVGNGNWQSICGGIDAFEVKGPCNAQLARSTGGTNPYTKIYQTGFHGVWKTYENSVHLGDNAQSVKMSCSDVDECASNSTNNCDKNADCTNTVGSYTCACKSGFSGIGISCSDIDECTDGSHKCSANGDCSNTIGSYKCTCKDGYYGNGTHCDSGITRIVCGDTSMAVYLSDYVMKSGGTTITLRQANCTVKRYMPKNELGLVTGYKDCGTTMKETSSHIEYTNEVRVKYSALSGGIIRSNDKSVAVTCSLPRHADTNINQILAPVTLVNATESGYGSFTITLAMMTSSDFSTKVTSFPVTVSLDSRIHFEAHVNSKDTDIILLFEQCSASPTMDKNHASKYDLVKDRCGVKDSTVQFHSSGNPHKNRFSFRSFKFVGDKNSVYLHCKVFMCHKTSTDPRCTNGCQGNNIKRVRRSTSDDEGVSASAVNTDDLPEREDNTKSLQRREIQNEYLPSKDYSLSIGPFNKAETAKARPAASKGFTATHGMGIGLGALGLVVIGIAVKFFISRKTDNFAKMPAKESKANSNANEGFELEV